VSCVVATPSCEILVCCEQRHVAGEDGCASCGTGRGRGWVPEQLTHMAEAYDGPDRRDGPDVGDFQASLVRPQRHMRNHSPVIKDFWFSEAGDMSRP
jgi:hypothetical protein